MSWLFFMDESGHDHKNMPFEARGGIALHAREVWPFIRSWNDALERAFGSAFSELGGEIKGSKLLDRDRMRWSRQMPQLDEASRHKGVRRFLTQKKQKEKPYKQDFTAYGQASIMMAESIFRLLQNHHATLFVSLIPRGARKPKGFKFDDKLRKDHTFLLERFFYFLEKPREHGLLVMDQTEKQNDKRFVKRLHNYFTKTDNGRLRTHWIVPSPLFVDSEMSPGVQAADLCLYCVNWGFRRWKWNFTGPQRDEIHEKFGGMLDQLQFKGIGYNSNGESYRTYGIFYVPKPYTPCDSKYGDAL